MPPRVIIGHDKILKRFADLVSQDRLANTYLFVGPEGIGKRLVAFHIANCLLCEATDRMTLSACGECPACHQVDAQTHPDFLTVSRLPEKNEIIVKQLMGDRESRMKEGLCHDIALKSFRGGRKIAVIDDADFFNAESANCLLKTLEEPPPGSLIILISTSVHRQLPTIRSRSQIMRFRPLSAEQIEQIIVQRDLMPNSNTDIRELALASGGSVKTAVMLSDSETLSFRSLLIAQLASLDPCNNEFIEAIGSFVNAAGKDSPAEEEDTGTPGALKRNRLRMSSEFAIQFYRNLMVNMHGQ